MLLGTSLAGGIAVALGGFFLGASLVVGFCFGKCFDFIGTILLWASHFVIYLYEMLAYYSLQLPFSRIVTGVPDIIKVILYYLVLLLVSRYMLYKYEDMEAVFEKKENQLYNSNSMKLFERNENFAMSSNYDEKMCSGVIMSKIFYAISGFIRDKRCLIICGVMLSASVLFITSNHHYDDFEMDMVDVGQGDGIFVAGDNNYFFDGGSTDVKNVGTYRILPFLKYKGIRHIDYWFVSHVDSDHMSGLLDALDSGYSIDNIVVDKYMLSEENFKEIESLANEQGVEIIVMDKGDIVSEDNLKFACVFAGSDEINDINGNSLAILGEYKEDDSDISFFIGGDMTVDSEKCLLSDASAERGYCIRGEQTTGYEELSNIDILKVSHHGSKSSSSEEFLKMLSPKISLISAGVNNRYHHPSKEVVSRLDELGIPHMCTQDYGRLHLYIDNSGVKVDGFLR